VVCDESLDLLGFEVQLGNRSQSDFYFDPEGFSVRVGDAKYAACISDAGGIVPAETSVPAFFVVTGTTDGRSLSVDRNFDLQIRPLDGGANGNGTANFIEPPTDHIPTSGDTAKEGRSKAVINAGKVDFNKGKKEATKKIKQGSVQVNAKDHANKAQVSVPKKHWFDLFKHNSVTVE
jgi:hypothetical protein